MHQINPFKPGERIQEIWQQNPLRIIEMLYDKTLEHLGHARAALAGWGESDYHQHLHAAIYVIERLRLTLDINQGSALASHLDDVYRYVTSQLLTLQHNQRVDILDETVNLLQEIREALTVVVNKVPQTLQN